MPVDAHHPRDDDDELAALRREYVEGLRSTVTAVRAALESHDLATLRTLAHQSRGAAGMYGFPALSDTAGLLEDAIHEGQGEQLIRELAEEFIRGAQAIVAPG